MQPAESPSDAHAKAILDAFESPLAYSGVQKLPGIRAVTAALMQVFHCLKVSQVEPGWSQLASRTEHLAFLVVIVIKYPDAQESFEEVCERRKDELTKLAKDMNQAAKQEKLHEFLNASSFVTVLDSVVKDLTGAISSETTQTKAKLKQAFEDEVSAIAEDVAETGHSTIGQTLQMTNNDIGDVGGPFDSANVTYGNAAIHRVLRGNKIGNVSGGMFSGNKAGIPLTPKYGFPPPAYPHEDAQF